MRFSDPPRRGLRHTKLRAQYRGGRPFILEREKEEEEEGKVNCRLVRKYVEDAPGSNLEVSFKGSTGSGREIWERSLWNSRSVYKFLEQAKSNRVKYQFTFSSLDEDEFRIHGIRVSANSRDSKEFVREWKGGENDSSQELVPPRWINTEEEEGGVDTPFPWRANDL